MLILLLSTQAYGSSHPWEPVCLWGSRPERASQRNGQHNVDVQREAVIIQLLRDTLLSGSFHVVQKLKLRVGFCCHEGKKIYLFLRAGGAFPSKPKWQTTHVYLFLYSTYNGFCTCFRHCRSGSNLKCQTTCKIQGLYHCQALLDRSRLQEPNYKQHSKTKGWVA